MYSKGLVQMPQITWATPKYEYRLTQIYLGHWAELILYSSQTKFKGKRSKCTKNTLPKFMQVVWIMWSSAFESRLVHSHYSSRWATCRCWEQMSRSKFSQPFQAILQINLIHWIQFGSWEYSIWTGPFKFLKYLNKTQ